MTPALKSILIKAAKNAVNAALVSLTPMIHDSGDYNLRDWHGLSHVGALIGGAILAREILVWFPELMKWSQSNGDHQ